ncbi:MAG: metallophosphoesterase family protein [Gemmatimonadetes bacterium]|nr:metallophosphoesterase family protein [Gemmatimonadota bacterium]
MSEERIAVIADVHGNRWALEAVLEDCARRGIASIVDLGDTVSGPLDPAGTITILRRIDPLGVLGNHDRALLEGPERARDYSEADRFAARHLSADDLTWLRRRGATAALGDGILLVHGTPSTDSEYLLEDVRAGGARLADPARVASALGATAAALILCGHSHVPRLVSLPDGRLVVNPGSVGLQAYTGELPRPHAVGAGSPHARYATLCRAEAGWQVDFVAVPYDHESAARAAARNGRDDWAEWIRTGRASL